MNADYRRVVRCLLLLYGFGFPRSCKISSTEPVFDSLLSALQICNLYSLVW